MLRYCVVLFAGIAAEALIYGEAEGGENDENLFRGICVLLRPPLTISQVHDVNLLSRLNWFKDSGIRNYERDGSQQSVELFPY